MGNYTAGTYLPYNKMCTNFETYLDVNGKKTPILYTALNFDILVNNIMVRSDQSED